MSKAICPKALLDNMNPSAKYVIRKSKIHGQGVFATRDLFKGEIVDVAMRLHEHARYMTHWIFRFPIEDEDYTITSWFGKFINHSWNPNCFLHRLDTDFLVVTSRTISTGEELTVDYRDTPYWIMKPDKNWK